jgi:DNA excision repair protein ERCC-6
MTDGTVSKQVDEALIDTNELENLADSSSTPQAQEPGLESLGTWSMDQDDLERDVAKRAEEAMAERDKELDQKRLEKTKNAISTYEKSKTRLEEKLFDQRTKISEKERIRKEIQKIEQVHLSALNQDLQDIENRIHSRNSGAEQVAATSASSRLPNETEREFLVRIGKITPFSNTFMASGGETASTAQDPNMSHQQLRLPGMELDQMVAEDSEAEAHDNTNGDDDYQLLSDEEPDLDDNEEEYDSLELSDVEFSTKKRKRPVRKSVKSKKIKEVDEFKGLDDGNELAYQTRLAAWVSKREAYRVMIDSKKEAPLNQSNEEGTDDRKEWEKPHPTHGDMKIDGRFKVPGDIFTSLFDYQKTGVQWLWELYSQKVGGIIGDEMGLGKTIQIVSFIAGLHYSGLLKKPVIIVCPATVMRQWVNEFHRWWPPLRVVILHAIGSGMDSVKEASLESSLERSEGGSVKLSGVKKQSGATSIVENVMKNGEFTNFWFLF